MDRVIPKRLSLKCRFILLLHFSIQYPGLFMDTFIKLEVKYLLNEDMADNKFVTLVSIFYDYFDNNILVKSTRKNLEFVVYEKSRTGNYNLFWWISFNDLCLSKCRNYYDMKLMVLIRKKRLSNVNAAQNFVIRNKLNQARPFWKWLYKFVLQSNYQICIVFSFLEIENYYFCLT